MALLLEPFKAGSLQLTNRLVMPPMATSKAEEDGKVSQAILDYYDEKSKGGNISLIIIEHSYISLEGKASKGQLSVADDSVIENLRKLSEVIHQNGTKTVMQINHAGSSTHTEVTGTNPVGPSAIANPRIMGGVSNTFTTPHELTIQEIKGIIMDFANAARRVKEAGFDGVEIHSAHGYLLNQFFSPLSNKRTDEYGGAVSDRIRIHLEVIKAVREAVGKDFTILLRLGASDYIEGGTNISDSVLAAREFEKAGVDILDISGGFCGFTIPGSNGENASTGKEGYFAPLTEAIKKEVTIPVILTGGITQAESAEELLIGGKADLIGIGRAVLSDSDWAKRATESFK